MNDPERFLRRGDETQRRLLSSAHDDGLPPGALRRLSRQAAILGGSLGLAAAAAAPVTAAATSAKVAAAVVFALGAAAGGGVLLSKGEKQTAPARASARPAATAFASPLQGPGAAERPTPLAAERPAHAAAALTERRPPPKARARRVAAPTLPRPEPSASRELRAEEAALGAQRGLREELAIVTSARRVLEAGDGTTALAQLAEHGRRFPAGRLGAEAEVLRIEALARAGRHADARRSAEAFLAREPKGLYAGRVRAVLTRPGPVPAGR